MMATSPRQPNPQVQRAQQMFGSLSRGRQVALVAAVVGLIASLFPWYSASYTSAYGSVSASVNGWHDWGLLAILGFIVAGVVAVLALAGTSPRALIPSLPPTATDAMVIMGAGIVSLISVIIFMISMGSGVSGTGISSGPSFGAYLGLLCSIAIIVGGYLMRTDPAI